MGVYSFSADTHKLFIGVTSYGDCTLKRIIVKGNSDMAYSLVGNRDYPVLNDIPNSEAENGQFCLKTTPSSGLIGWRYYNETWNVVTN